ncbi:MAG: hypothetical protein CMH30_00350 [Micavibrio sp.]|nr:hypothetical protein [Micavibrio sp.]|tara:strand:- start:306 stop:1376 length:1071 start_codon:yes stop_codon:yes gene_type:complete
MRYGPRPLWLHLANASKIAASRQDMSLFSLYVQKVGEYFRQPVSAKNTGDYTVVWAKGDVKVYAAQKSNKSKKRILLIPSLINRHSILDLLPEYSFFQYLNDQGLEPLLFDWGDVFDPSQATLSECIETYLIPAMAALLKEEDDVALGYCMGGVMLLAAAQKAGVQFDHLKYIFMATPWDFEKTDKNIRLTAQNIWAQSLAMRVASTYVPVDMLQSFFGSIEPEDTVMKYINIDLNEDSLKTKLFVAIEDWLNDGRNLGWGVFESCLKEWYIDNLTAVNQWQCCGETIDPKKIKNKSLCVIPQKDKLVSPESAEALNVLLKHSERLTPELGHIGLMGSTKAKENVWKPIVNWIKAT